MGRLARRPIGVRREALLSTLSPDKEVALASHSLNTLVHSTREPLDDEIGGAPPVVQPSGFYRLNLRPESTPSQAPAPGLSGDMGRRCRRCGSVASITELFSSECSERAIVFLTIPFRGFSTTAARPQQNPVDSLF